jgi:hypothetical protein
MRSILFAFVLLVAASETASADVFTVTVVNHRAIGTLAQLSHNEPCSGGGDRSDMIQDTATYTCDSAGAQRYPSGRIYLFALVSPRGVQMCNLFWADRPWRDTAWGPELPPGLNAEQQVSSGRPDDKTRPGCVAKQLGPAAYQVDTYVASGWLGDEY